MVANNVRKYAIVMDSFCKADPKSQTSDSVTVFYWLKKEH